MVCPSRPLDGFCKESQVIIALDWFPSIAAVFAHNQSRITRSNITAAIDDIRVIRIYCDGFPELSAFSVAMNLNQIRDINSVESLTAVPRTEDCGFCITEICTATEQINGVLVSGVNAHGIHAQEATFCIVQIIQHLIPVTGVIVVLICTTNVCTGIHCGFTSHNTGHKAAACNAECANFHLVCNAFRCHSCQRGTAQQIGYSKAAAQNCTGRNGSYNFFHGFLHVKILSFFSKRPCLPFSAHHKKGAHF